MNTDSNASFIHWPQSQIEQFLDRTESNVRSYSRSFPSLFVRGSGPFLIDAAGREYIDFFCGAGALNYGHNHRVVKHAMMQYLECDGVLHGLDMATAAKLEFIDAFLNYVVKPRLGEYKLQFPGPTGTNAVECAIKLARKHTGRTGVVYFTRAFHGMTAGSLSLSGNLRARKSLNGHHQHSMVLPYDGYLKNDDGGEHGLDTGLLLFERMLSDPSSGMECPAAVIVETIQAEGGVRVARPQWIKELQRITREHGIVLIIDDIQVGCGRAGNFFSFEKFGVQPDMICLSKSISGSGLPMSLLLLRASMDCWSPGEHSGTFRGNNLAFVAARAVIQEFWRDQSFENNVAQSSHQLELLLRNLVEKYTSSMNVDLRGRGMIWGIDVGSGELAAAVCQHAFAEGLIVEKCGEFSQVIKLLPPLLCEASTLEEGVSRLDGAFKKALSSYRA